MEHYYTNERNAQIVIALLKAYGIKKIVASPGTTNISLVGSAQNDQWFEMYSLYDERSAAYFACGLAEESGEPVVLSCTGATASRNYMPGLTEAYYRKLPVIAITSTHRQSHLHNLIGQVIDREIVPNDVSVLSVRLQYVKDSDDDWDCQIKVNRALNALKRDGGGPVHLNLETLNIRQNFDVKEIKGVKKILCRTIFDDLPDVPKGRIGIFVGSHQPWSEELTHSVELFCEQHNAVVFCDHTSNYQGKYKIMTAMLGSQDNYRSKACDMELLVHIGEISGSYESSHITTKTKAVWRVSPDGRLQDPYRKLTDVFDMREIDFFQYYTNTTSSSKTTSYYDICKADNDKITIAIPELPFSNIWIAQRLSKRIPVNAEVHMGILNSLRSWDFFEVPAKVRMFCNVGGFGIDGCMSSMMGASMCHKDKIYFGFFGDLSFFYDLNIVANRHIGNNVRILLVNNGKGIEFRHYTHQAALWGDKADKYIAAGGHNGKQSPVLIKHFAQDLGYEYLTASNKQEFEKNAERFLTPEITEKPMIFEVFTTTEDETQALYQLRHSVYTTKQFVKREVVKVLDKSIGSDGVNKIKKVLGK